MCRRARMIGKDAVGPSGKDAVGPSGKDAVGPSGKAAARAR